MDNIITFLHENFQLRINKIERLYEGEGRNYSLVADTGEKYILKIYENQEELISFITTLLTYLDKTRIKIQFPHPVKNLNGMEYTTQGEKTLVIFKWIEGATIECINTKMAEELGEIVCILDTKLCEYYDGHERDFSKYEGSIWNVTNIHQYDEELEIIKEYLGEHDRLVKDSIAEFDKIYPEVQSKLNRSLIHNDINPGNFLYGQDQKLLGIIDFTEISHTHRICEVGVALAYIMQIGDGECMKIGKSFIRGYEKEYCFTNTEQEALLMFTKLRLCMTIIYNTKQLHLRKEVTDLQARFIRNAKKMLSTLSEITNDEFVEKLFPQDQSR